MTRLSGKTALVTGGSRGIGRAIVERLAADGAVVVFSYQRDEGAAADVVAAVAANADGGSAGRAMAVQADLGSRDAGRILYQSAEDAVGPLDILVNNAGVAPTDLIADCSDEDFAEVLTVNLSAPFALIREAARRMRDGGRIINVSTLNTVMAGPGMAAYASSKAALELLSRVAAYELGERGITVNSVLPGATDTDLFRSNNPDEDGYAGMLAMTPLRRLGQPADVADVVAFLASADGRWVTGQAIRASGGL
jgi:3-oxoacyl-[acyl-carrier protein] reductase